MHPPAIRRAAGQRAGGRRRDVHLRCRHADGLGGALLQVNGKRRLIGSFNHGSMANAMLQAIGAQAACPGRQVISLSGDGGFTMMMGDFAHPDAARAAGEDRGVQQRRRWASSSWR